VVLHSLTAQVTKLAVMTFMTVIDWIWIGCFNLMLGLMGGKKEVHAPRTIVSCDLDFLSIRIVPRCH
jgi:hypothetical protein